jgi:N-acetylglucosamine-6-phosphate deacetylase
MPTTPRRAFQACALLAAITLTAAASQPAPRQSSAPRPTSTSPLAEPPNGPRSSAPARVLLTGATVHATPDRVLDNASILIDDGVIVSVTPNANSNTATDPTARVIDCTGLHIYPGFVDAWVQVDAPKPDPKAPGSHWNPLITPQRSALDGPGLPADKAKDLRELGFVAAAITPDGGIIRGTAAVVSTAERATDASVAPPRTFADQAHMVFGYERNASEAAYPDSHMGIIALIRQTLMDAAHHRKSAKAGTSAHSDDASCLAALDPAGTPTFWNCSSVLEALLADKVLAEFEITNAVLVGAGDEYQRLAAVAGLERPMVVPLRFPAKPEAQSVGELNAIDLADLMAWEQAPTNPRRLHDAGVPLAITSSKLPKGAEFWENMRRAVEEGSLAPSDALDMLTRTPALMLGVSGTLGTIEPGKAASFVIASDDLFTDEDAQIVELWADGREHVINPRDDNDKLDASWTLTAPATPHDATRLVIDDGSIKLWPGPGEPPAKDDQGHAKDEAEPAADDQDNADAPDWLKARNARLDHPTLSFVLDHDGGAFLYSATLHADGVLRGTVLDPAGQTREWSAARLPDAAKDDDQDDDEDAKDDDDGDDATELPPEDLGGLPFGAYALPEPPSNEPILLTNARVWTSAAPGIIERGYVLVENGTIKAVGSLPDNADLPAIPVSRRTRTIDVAGANITPGMIDAHSHTGLFRFGVNEGTQSVTAECRIADSIDPGFINWYRQLAGGVTTANLLHGSANAIGGQSQTVKVRWGAARAEDLFLDSAKPGIKFALGENVKQSNWGDEYTTRYPQTRMGVETIIRDRFTAAREYLDRGRTLEGGRKDLELEALAEILAGERLVHCHSYRQDEILMLCRVAADFGFTIGTFQHGLEVYKAAEAVRDHAIGASIFSDWWAFKVEVQDAIPYAGPLQSAAGVLTSFNSDSDELARRMNLEAAKALKYARASNLPMTPADALKFVTINPAIQLGIDARVGSLEPGKDADIVVWTADPLSTFSKPSHVFIDGREYFSLDADAAARARVTAERTRIIQKLIASKDRPEDKAKSDDDSEASEDSGPEHAHHDHAGHAARAHAAAPMLPGDCGCHTSAPAHKEIK